MGLDPGNRLELRRTLLCVRLTYKMVNFRSKSFANIQFVLEDLPGAVGPPRFGNKRAINVRFADSKGCSRSPLSRVEGEGFNFLKVEFIIIEPDRVEIKFANMELNKFIKIKDIIRRRRGSRVALVGRVVHLIALVWWPGTWISSLNGKVEL